MKGKAEIGDGVNVLNSSFKKNNISRKYLTEFKQEKVVWNLKFLRKPSEDRERLTVIIVTSGKTETKGKMIFFLFSHFTVLSLHMLLDLLLLD